MDNQKDIESPEKVSLSIDGRHIRTNPFGENRAAERAYRRAERLAAALYLVTNHISTEEPLRVEVRRDAPKLVSDVLGLRDEMRSNRSGKPVAFFARIRTLITLVRLLAASGHVSLQNAEVLIEALDELGNFVAASQRTILSENITVSREELLDVGSVAVSVIRDKTVTARKDASTVKDMRRMSDKNGDRKKTAEVRVRNILEIVRQGGEIGIREIAAHLPEYSEKMIQRELLELVSKGQLKKIGLKRWSRYSLPA